MPEIKERDGVIILESDRFDLKIDKARKIYVKRKEENSFSYINHDTPPGMTAVEKKKVIYELYRHIDSKLKSEEKNL